MWSEVLSVVGAAVSLVVLLIGALGRETLRGRDQEVADLKRRLDQAELKVHAQALSIAGLEVRGTGMKESLERIEALMVPRAEWEARHKATDGRLDLILAALSERGSHPDLDPPPPMPPRRRAGDSR